MGKGRSLDNALIGLMRNEPVHITDGYTGSGTGSLDGLGDIDNGMAEHLVAGHA